MISVIIPLYNKEAIIESSLHSVLSQDYDDFEVVVVNDGSTDRSAEIVKSIHDSRIVYVEQENGGPSKARNTGIYKAKGKWLYFIDADDCMEVGALAHFANLTIKYPNVDIFIGETYFNNNGEKKIFRRYLDGYVSNNFKYFYYDYFFSGSGSSLYSRRLCQKTPYNESIWRYEDWECLFRRYKNCCLFLTGYPVATVNVDFASASHSRKDLSEDFVGHIVFKGKTFWEKMCLYKLYLWERPYYPNQINCLYPFLKYRFDLLLFTKFLNLPLVKNVFL